MFELIAPRIRWALAVAATFFALACWTWMRWPDPLIDFGRELYIAWRLAAGEHLHRDLAYFSGVLSPYFNALCFELFGTSLHTLVLVNLGLLGAFTALHLRVARLFGSPGAAAVATVMFLILCGFAQLTPVGNYNWVAPYAHDMTHGTLCVTAALAAAGRFLRGGRHGWLALAGLLLGASFLTRPEVFFAGAAALFTALLLGAILERCNPLSALARGLLVTAATVAVPLATYFVCARHLGERIALVNLLGTWPATLDWRVAQLPLFQASTGLRDLPVSLVLLALAIAIHAVVLAIVAGISCLPLPESERWDCGVALAIAGAAWVTLAWWTVGVPAALYRPLPLAVAVVIALCAFEAKAPPDAERVAAGLLALLLLGKIALNTRMHHYGAFACPLALAVVVPALLTRLPAWVARRGGSHGACRALLLGVLAALTLPALVRTRHYAGPPLSPSSRAGRGVVTASGPDTFLADRRGAAVNEALAWIEKHVGPTETVAVLPEGAMLNFLSRRRTSVPHTNFMPTEFILFGEANLLKWFEASPPDHLILAHKDTSEFGYTFFGTNYGRSLMDWVRAHYREVDQIGARPFTGPHFGMLMMSRRK